MQSVSKISSEDLPRHLPAPFRGVDVNFCRNPRCASFSIPPDPYRRKRDNLPAPQSALVGEIRGAREKVAYYCPTCGASSRVKNNRGIFEEYQRLDGLQAIDPLAPGCKTEGCFAKGMPVDAHPEFYRKYGTTKNGDPKHQCRLCKTVFSLGSPTRRQKRSDKNKLVFSMLVNGIPLSKICVISGLSYNDVYAKIDFFYDQVRSFTARRQNFDEVDWSATDSQFATDSQSLMINWPTRRERTPVVVQHLCTAHHESGFIMEAAIQFDPSITMDEVEEKIAAAGDLSKPQCFRENGRVWSKTEFEQHLRSLKKTKKVKTIDLYQLPHSGALVRYDILQFAHAMRIREMLSGVCDSLYFVLDEDTGLRGAFSAVFAREIQNGAADIATVGFDKDMTNDMRKIAVEEGRDLLASQTGLTPAQIKALSDLQYAQLVDAEIQTQIVGVVLTDGFAFPYHTKSEPHRRVRLLVDRPRRQAFDTAVMIRRATLRSVDAYFHKFRSNVRFAARPSTTPSSRGHTWDRYYLYKPEIMVKVAEIYRFSHNWVGNGRKETPAMKIGLAKGKIYERDVFKI